MIQRIVFIKLQQAYTSPDVLREVIDKTMKILPAVRGIRSLEVCEPSDPSTRRQWDLCLLVRFASMPDVEAYRTDPVHRSYVDVFLKPMLDKIDVYNFELRQS